MKEKSNSIRKRISNDKKLIIEQLKKTPIVTLACEKVGIGRATYYRWRKTDRRFLSETDAAISQGILLVNDMAESQLLTSIRDGNMTGLIFWLKHHHPKYETRIELRQSPAEPDEKLNKRQEEIIRQALEITATGETLDMKGERDEKKEE